MNGRVYDPVIGRFLSADPFIQSPDDLQSLNRYSYVNNNPLSYTDPSGFFLKKLLKKIKNFIKKVWKAVVVTAIAIVATVLTAGIAAWASGIIAASLGAFGSAIGPIIGGMIKGAISGFIGGMANGLLHGGSLSQALKAGLNGALTGAISGGLAGLDAASINNVFAKHALKALGKGLLSGIQREQQGGKFLHGFFSGAMISMAGSLQGVIDTHAPRLVRVLAGAVIGGTVSKLGGGKFVNGAATAAFARLFNDCAGQGCANPKFKASDVVAKLNQWTDKLYQQHPNGFTKMLNNLAICAKCIVELVSDKGKLWDWAKANPGLSIPMGAIAVAGYVGYSLLRKEFKIPSISLMSIDKVKLRLGGSYSLKGNGLKLNMKYGGLQLAY